MTIPPDLPEWTWRDDVAVVIGIVAMGGGVVALVLFLLSLVTKP